MKRKQIYCCFLCHFSYLELTAKYIASSNHRTGKNLCKPYAQIFPLIDEQYQFLKPIEADQKLFYYLINSGFY
jgi:hypothetical protein